MIRQIASQAAGQSVRCVEHRNPRVLEQPQPSLGVPASCPQEHHTLVGPITLADDLLSLGVGPGTRHYQRPHPGIIDHMLHDLWERLTVGKACHIGRICSPSEALQDPVDAVTRRVAKRRQIETSLTAHVGSERADAARVGHHRDARHARLGSVRQQVRDLQEFVVILHPDHPVLGKDRIVSGIRARQRRGMRLCGPRSKFRTPDLDKDDRLAALCRELCHLEKLIGPLEAFDKTSNDPSIRIVQQVAGKVGKIEVRLVSCRDDVAEADAVLHRPHQERPERRRAALAHQADRPGQTRRPARGRGGPDVVLDIREPQAVGAADTHARGAGKLPQFPLQVTPVVHPALGKARRDHDRRTRPLAVALLQDIEHLVVRHHDAHDVGGLRQVRHARVRLHPHDLVITRVHGIDLHPVFGLERRSQEPPAILHPRRRTHDRNGARVEHFVDRRHLWLCPELHDTP